jgi:hypothetical protein
MRRTCLAGADPEQLNKGKQMDPDQTKTLETTDSWPLDKILKHVFLPKPKGSPKAGKKEIALRILVACVCAAFVFYIRTGGKSLPSCGSTDTQGLVGKIVNDMPAAKIAGARFVSVKDITEQGYNKSEDIRSCHATLVTTAGEDELQYSIKWQDKAKKLFYVTAQIID